MENETTQKEKKDNFFLNISLNVIIPSVIMTKMSSDQYLGQFWGLVVALFFPIAYGIFDFVKAKKFNFFSALGFVSVLLTGGIGLFQLDKKWMVVKETAIPLLMGVAVLVSNRTSKPFVRIFFNEMLDLDKVDRSFSEAGHEGLFEKYLMNASNLLGLTFFISAILNYVLAIWILEGNPGTEAFNQSLGKMTALSFPVITIPMMVMVGLILFFLFRSIKKYTQLEIESVFRQ